MNQHSPSGRHVLYISYDGLTDQLGRSQVLPYLVGLSALGHDIAVLSFEKPQQFAAGEARTRELCAGAGIAWHPLRYHRRPPVLSTLYDVRAMARAAERLHRRRPFDLVHARSYLPAAAGLRLKRGHGVSLLFDMRGFWPDERVEGGSWPQSSLLYRAVYRYMKRLEARLLAGADHVVALTEAALPLLRERPELPVDTAITVIPCCADFDHFPLVTAEAHAAARAELDIAPDAQVIAYLGSVGAWYMLGEMLDFFAAYRLRHPDAVMLFVTQQPPEIFAEAGAARGLPAGAIRVRSASREQVPQFMAAADAGLFFIRPVSSKIASSPTKMAEMMALGLPIVANAGVGDVASILAETGCGVAIDRFDASAYSEAIDRLDRLACTPLRIRAAGLARFDVAEGVRRYDAIYSSLAANVSVVEHAV